MTKETWTEADEIEFCKLAARRKRVTESRLKAVTDAVQLIATTYKLPAPELAAQMVKRAEQIRDALEPYDSGVRCAKENPDGN